MERGHENVSHTTDTTVDCFQLLSNSLATGTTMVSIIFSLLGSKMFSLDELQSWLIQMLETPSRKKKQVSKQSNQEVNQVPTNISGRCGVHNNS